MSASVPSSTNNNQQTTTTTSSSNSQPNANSSGQIQQGQNAGVDRIPEIRAAVDRALQGLQTSQHPQQSQLPVQQISLSSSEENQLINRLNELQSELKYPSGYPFNFNPRGIGEVFEIFHSLGKNHPSCVKFWIDIAISIPRHMRRDFLCMEEGRIRRSIREAFGDRIRAEQGSYAEITELCNLVNYQADRTERDEAMIECQNLTIDSNRSSSSGIQPPRSSPIETIQRAYTSYFTRRDQQLAQLFPPSSAQSSISTSDIVATQPAEYPPEGPFAVAPFAYGNPEGAPTIIGVGYLPIAAIGICHRVCRVWNAIMQDSGVWQVLVSRDFIVSYPLGAEFNAATYRLMYVDSDDSDDEMPSLSDEHGNVIPGITRADGRFRRDNNDQNQPSTSSSPPGTRIRTRFGEVREQPPSHQAQRSVSIRDAALISSYSQSAFPFSNSLGMGSYNPGSGISVSSGLLFSREWTPLPASDTSPRLTHLPLTSGQLFHMPNLLSDVPDLNSHPNLTWLEPNNAQHPFGAFAPSSIMSGPNFAEHIAKFRKEAIPDETLQSFDISALEADDDLKPKIARWLQKLTTSTEYLNEQMRPLVCTRVLSSLYFATQNREFLNTTLPEVLDQAVGSCEDDAAKILNELELKKKIVEASDSSLGYLVKLLKGAYKVAKLKEFGIRFVTDKKSIGQYVDDVSVHLGLQVKLKDVLGLPVDCQDMNYFEYSRLTSSDLVKAKEEVNEAAKNINNLADYFLMEKTWIDRLKKEFSQELNTALAPIRIEMDALEDLVLACTINEQDYKNRANALGDKCKILEAEWLKNKTLELLKS